MTSGSLTPSRVCHAVESHCLEFQNVFMNAGFAEFALRCLVKAHNQCANVLVKLDLFRLRFDSTGFADHRSDSLLVSKCVRWLILPSDHEATEKDHTSLLRWL